MIFFGRPLAIRSGVGIWQSHLDESVYVHFVDQDCTVHLPAELIETLYEALSAALETAREPEAPKDRARRLQILRDRLATVAQKER